MFVRKRRKYWLLPVMFALLFLGGLLVLAETSALSSFLYAVF